MVCGNGVNDNKEKMIPADEVCGSAFSLPPSNVLPIF
jgi:hypothetical protein